MVITVLGAELLVSSAADIARAYGVSDAFIGLTIVAIGTSAGGIEALRKQAEGALADRHYATAFNIARQIDDTRRPD